MYSVEQRDALRERVLEIAKHDPRVVAGAVVGSLALGGGDRFSDLDLTFAVADGFGVADVLDEWTQTLAAELAAVALVDLRRGATTYRVFLLPAQLQFDLSMTPAAQFRPAGPRFRLLFGETAGGETAGVAPEADDTLGRGVIYALHSRACIERGRIWQAEHYISTVRDHALTPACLREGVPAIQARGYDDLSAATRARFDETHIASLDPRALRAALAASVQALIAEATAAGLPLAGAVQERLKDLGAQGGDFLLGLAFPDGS